MVRVAYIGATGDMCYSDDTEVLTEKGWKFWKDVTIEDKFATLNPSTHKIRYTKPKRIIAEQYTGDMYHFYTNIGGIDLLVTPNHRMFTQGMKSYRKTEDHYYNWTFEKASDFFGKSRWFTRKGIWEKEDVDYFDIAGRSVKADDWLEFLGYYLSEGSATITKELHYIVQIRQFKHLGKMAESLQRVSLNKINIRPDGRVIVNDKNLCLYLKKLGDKYNKFIPREVLNECSQRQLRILFDALMLGDGHDNRGKHGGSQYNTSSLRLRDDFQELLLKVGLSGSFNKLYSKGDKVVVYDREYTAREDHWGIKVRWQNGRFFKHSEKSIHQSKSYTEKIIQYQGMVYCASVPPDETLFVRRNGHTVWSGNSGYAEAARNNIAALLKCGIEVDVLPVSFEQFKGDLGPLGDLVAEHRVVKSDAPIRIIHTVPVNYQSLHHPNYYNIGYTVWEGDRIPKDWVNHVNLMDEIWVPCKQNIDAFRDSGVTVPLKVVPHTFDTDYASDRLTKDAELAAIDQLGDAYTFYGIFQFLERKHPVGVLKSYLTEFGADENVALILKTYISNPTNHAENQQVKRYVVDIKKHLRMDKYPKVYLITSVLSRDQIELLHKRGDCFLHLARAEGWGIPVTEAMLAKNPVIVCPYGGPSDFVTHKDTGLTVPYQETPVCGMPWPTYTGEMNWAEPDLGAAKRWMRWCFENREEAKQMGERANEYIKNTYCWENIGNLMAKRLHEIDGGKLWTQKS